LSDRRGILAQRIAHPGAFAVAAAEPQEGGDPPPLAAPVWSSASWGEGGVLVRSAAGPNGPPMSPSPKTPAGNLKPAKDKSTERIDGIVATIMAIGRAMVAQEEPQPAYSMFFV
jgi:hypothetical protein